VDWRQQFEDLQQRRPDLAERVCRRLLVEMQRQGMVDFEELDHEIAVALRLVGSRPDIDPNRPKPKLPSDSHIALYDLALKHAEQYLPPEEISATILLVEKRQLAHEVSRIAEDLETPIPLLREKVREFLDFAPGEAAAPPEDVIDPRHRRPRAGKEGRSVPWRVPGTNLVLPAVERNTGVHRAQRLRGADQRQVQAG
jgi:hypothetical protein